MDESGGEELIHTAHALLRDFGQSRVATIAAVNALAFGGGCELAMACDVRIAAEAAVFGQPEIKLGIIPGFGGTQRLPRLVGPNKALEMNLIGDAILAGEALESGLVNRVVPDHELFETALMWGRKLAAQAPLAVEQIKLVSHAGDLDAGHRGREAGLRHRLPQRGRQGGHRRLPRQAHAEVERQVDKISSRRAENPSYGVSVPSAEVAARGADPRVRLHRRADRRRGLGALRDPRLPHAGDRAVGQRRPDGGRPHRRLRARPGPLLVLLPAALSVARRQAAERGPRGACRARAAGAAGGRDHAEHRPPAPRRGLRERGRGARLDRDLLLQALRGLLRDRARSTRSSTPTGSRSARPAAVRSSPTSSSSARCCRRARWRRPSSWPSGPS